MMATTHSTTVGPRLSGKKILLYMNINLNNLPRHFLQEQLFIKRLSSKETAAVSFVT